MAKIGLECTVDIPIRVGWRPGQVSSFLEPPREALIRSQAWAREAWVRWVRKSAVESLEPPLDHLIGEALGMVVGLAKGGPNINQNKGLRSLRMGCCKKQALLRNDAEDSRPIAANVVENGDHGVDVALKYPTLCGWEPI